VITGGEEPTGACCYPPAVGGAPTDCIVTTLDDCINNLGGVYEGDGTNCQGMEACCLPNGICVMADALCCVNELGGTPQGPGTTCSAPAACCMTDGTCQMLDPVCCDDMGGTPYPGQTCTAAEACCLPNNICQMLDPVCCVDMGGIPQGSGTACTTPAACCMTDGSCQNLDPLCCDEAGGTPSPIGAQNCLGDNNGNNIDDACEVLEKFKYEQLPDTLGWDVNATYPMILADDWPCTQTGNVKDFHFWGSWKGDVIGEIDHFVLSIHADIPEDPDNGIFYSRPGETLREIEVYEYGVVAYDPLTMEGWYDPANDDEIPDDHNAYFRYDVYLPESEWFWQTEGTIYWLNISAVLSPTSPAGAIWGWKSSDYHFMDDACWAYWGDLQWVDLWEPEQPLKNFFEGHLDNTGQIIPAVSWGQGAYTTTDKEQWFWYPQDEPGWWNIWFYDHPFDDERIKDIYILFIVRYDDPTITEMQLELTVNWSTPEWSELGLGRPPLPDDANEAIYIGRGDPMTITEPGEYEYVVIRIPDYNPEWVSVDIRGSNVWVEGEIYHICRGSLDLAFRVTGDAPDPPKGACCYPDPIADPPYNCIFTTEDDCVNNLGGIYEGDGSRCQGIQACCLDDNTCVMADALCCRNELGGTPQGQGTQCSAPEACCMTDGTCQMLDPLCCADIGGTPQGPGTQCSAPAACCLKDGACQMLDPLCCLNMGGTPQAGGGPCTTPEACCIDDGTCQMLDPLCCTDMGGSPQGSGTACSSPEAC